MILVPMEHNDALRGFDRWPNIAQAAKLSHQKLSELEDILGDLITTDEGCLVVFGSLARGEFTNDSDLDWTILIDGRADSNHLAIVHELRPRLEQAKFKVPGPTEVFGGLIFSHELVHAIGGDEDTNKNMTRRLLLLLESKAVGAEGKGVHRRVVEGILNRYVVEDASFISTNQRPIKIPRFLLNDVVRFWRTMAVDYVNKYRARAGDKWALRNIKLRMSRKLLFISGLLMCISWALKDGQSDDRFVVQKLVTHLLEWTDRSPLDSLGIIIQKFAPSLGDEIFNSYDKFLELLNDQGKRQILEELSPDDAYKNKIFLEARKMADQFDAALLKLLFDSNDQITQLVRKYGVF
jgi:predicted nucleotidyltransferase